MFWRGWLKGEKRKRSYILVDMKRITDNWYYIVIGVMAVSIFFIWNDTEKLNNAVILSEQRAKGHETSSEYYKGLYDKQIKNDKQQSKSYDSLLDVKPKIQINEKLKIVDRYTIGDKQSYFTDRYGSK